MKKFDVSNVNFDKVKKGLGIVTAVGTGLFAVINAIKEQEHDKKFDEMAKNYEELKAAFDASKKD